MLGSCCVCVRACVRVWLRVCGTRLTKAGHSIRWRMKSSVTPEMLRVDTLHQAESAELAWAPVLDALWMTLKGSVPGMSHHVLRISQYTSKKCCHVLCMFHQLP